MSFPANRFAILIDGEWFKKSLHSIHGQFPDFPFMYRYINKVIEEVIKGRHDYPVLALYRIFYYTADPLTETIVNPLNTDKRKNYSLTTQYEQNIRLIEKLENTPNVAVRRGRLVHRGWTLKRRIENNLLQQAQNVEHGLMHTAEFDHIEPNITQKGVDMMIGIDMTSLALKRLVSNVVIVSGDSDLVPAMKLARTEGLRVALVKFKHSTVQKDLAIHTDLIYEI